MSAATHSPAAASVRSFLPAHGGRILTIGHATFTQLMRMKVFYFLIAFLLVLLAANFFRLPLQDLPENRGFAVLRAVAASSLGVMTLFSVVLAVVATALLLPRDLEDRTLYTILAKPVPRCDYLAGKLLGVLALLAVSLALMDGMMLLVFKVRAGMFAQELEAMAAAGQLTADQLASARAELAANVPGAALQNAVVAVWLRAAVIAAMTLFVSTFATSTLFTTVVGFLVYFLGNFQADLRALWQGPAGQGVTMLGQWGAWLVAVVLPDFQLFNVIDAAVEGAALPLEVVGKLAVASGFHVAVYLLAAWFVFAGREV